MQRAVSTLRIGLGFIYFFFGFLKFFPDLSPAELIAEQTIIKLSLSWIDGYLASFLLAGFECLIGLGFIFNFQIKAVFYMLLFHIAGTFTPMILIPHLTFNIFPFAPTLDGQYILKNIVLVSSGWVVYENYKEVGC